MLNQLRYNLQQILLFTYLLEVRLYNKYTFRILEWLHNFVLKINCFFFIIRNTKEVSLNLYIPLILFYVNQH